MNESNTEMVTAVLPKHLPELVTIAKKHVEQHVFSAGDIKFFRRYLKRVVRLAECSLFKNYPQFSPIKSIKRNADGGVQIAAHDWWNAQMMLEFAAALRPFFHQDREPYYILKVIKRIRKIDERLDRFAKTMRQHASMDDSIPECYVANHDENDATILLKVPVYNSKKEKVFEDIFSWKMVELYLYGFEYHQDSKYFFEDAVEELELRIDLIQAGVLTRLQPFVLAILTIASLIEHIVQLSDSKSNPTGP